MVTPGSTAHAHLADEIVKAIGMEGRLLRSVNFYMAAHQVATLSVELYASADDVHNLALVFEKYGLEPLPTIEDLEAIGEPEE